jgi:hypothetical protein
MQEGARGRASKAENNETAVENLTGKFHVDDPAISAFFAGRWWLAMRGVDQVVRSGLSQPRGRFFNLVG